MAVSDEPVLQARELYRFYHGADDEVFALRGVSVEVHRGEKVAVVGPSGSGKSTLLHCCAGLDEPDGGRVAILGRWITRRPERERAAMRARSIGVLMQTGNLIPHLTVRQNIELARALGKQRRRATGSLNRLGIERLEDEIAARLSGGELARAGLAVALAAAPELLLADEPTGELDEETEKSVLDVLRDVAEAGTAIVVATHSARVSGIADRIVRLDDGRVADG